MELLEVNHLCKTYGSGETAVHALKDVSFSVPKGEYVAVVGESGSGKSTLLNLIGGLDTPTFGKVLIDGKDVFAMKDRELTIFRRRNIGFIFQAYTLKFQYKVLIDKFRCDVQGLCIGIIVAAPACQQKPCKPRLGIARGVEHGVMRQGHIKIAAIGAAEMPAGVKIQSLHCQFTFT